MDNHQLINVEDKLDEMVSSLTKEDIIACDLEASELDVRKASLEGMGLGTSDRQYFIPFPNNLPFERVTEALTTIFKDRVVIFHNAKYDLELLREKGLPYPTKIQDTLIMSWLVDENVQHGLKQLAKGIFGRESKKWTELNRNIDLFRGVGEIAQELTNYCCEDVKNTYDLYFHFLPILKVEGLLPDYERLELKIIPVLVNMELRGIRINAEFLKEKQVKVLKLLQEIEVKMKEAVKNDMLNVRSPVQLETILFDVLKYPPATITNAGKRSTENEVLEDLVKQHNLTEDDFVPLLLKFRDLDKLYTTYFVALVDQGGKDQVIHTNFMQHGTRTGRLSSNEPNLQNIPARSDEWNVRDAFIPRDGYKFLIADYCLVPNTKILCSDLVWKSIKDIKIGENVVGFNENLVSKDKGFNKTKVISKKILKRPCYKITTNLGIVICSQEHKWLYCGKQNYIGMRKREWRETQELKIGDKLAYYISPWKVDTTLEGSYLKGVFDGEGYMGGINVKNGIWHSIGIGQKEGLVLTEIKRLLVKKGYVFGINKNGKSNVENLRFKGRGASLRFLGSIRPIRLLAKSDCLWEGRRTWGRNNTPAIIEKIDFIGEQEVIALGTESKTFIAEGFLSHNSQIELRILAHFSQDDNMVKTFMENRDIHAMTMKLTGITERRIAKAVNFGLIYGVGPRTLAKTLNIQEEDAKKYIEKFFDGYPKVKYYIQRIQQGALNDGYVTMITGRKRRFQEIKDRRWFNMIQRQAINTKIQGSAADLIKIAMVKLANALIPFDAHMLLQIHDEVIVETPLDKIEEVKKVITEVMENALQLRIPIKVKVTEGMTWVKD